jgi:hypothetical protein
MNRSNRKNETAEDILRALVKAVDVTGGLVADPYNKNVLVPEADHEWSDIADIYLRACALLGAKPLVQETAEEEAADLDNILGRDFVLPEED